MEELFYQLGDPRKAIFQRKINIWPQDNFHLVKPNTKLKNLHRTKVKIYQTTDLPIHQTDAYLLVEPCSCLFKSYFGCS